MFDSSVTASSMEVNGLSFADSPVSIDDLAFLELMLTLQDSDRAIMDKMREIRALQDRKSAISKEMAEIDRLIKSSDAEDGDDWVIDQAKNEATRRARQNQAPPAPEPKPESEQESPSDPLASAAEVCLDMVVEAGIVVDPRRPSWHDLSDEEIRDRADDGSEIAMQEAAERGMYKKEELDSRLDELQREFEDLDKSSELMLIDLSRLMNKRNQAVQLTTNIMQSCHQTAMGVIANFK